MGYEKTFHHAPAASTDVGIRTISVRDLLQALQEGYDDFNTRPSFWAFLVVVYPLFALLLILLLRGESLMYLAFPMVAGFTLLGPVVSVALFEMSRRRELGLDLSWRSAFDFVHSRSFAPILALSVVMMLLYVGWLYMAQLIYLGLFGASPPESLAEFWTLLVTTREGAALAVYGLGVGFLFAFAAFALSVIAFPLLLDRQVSFLAAMATSIRSVMVNPFVMAVWAMIVVLLLAAGTAIFLIGLAAVLPILGHATWHLYKKVVEP